MTLSALAGRVVNESISFSSWRSVRMKRVSQVVKVGVVKFVGISSERLTFYTSKDTIGSGKYVVLLHRKLIQI